MSPRPLDGELAQRLREGVGDGVFPSAVALVSRDHRVLGLAAAGDAVPETRFDVASLTKLVTATAVGLLWHGGAVRLEDELLPGVTVEDALRHRTGLPAWRPYFKALRAEAAAPGGATLGSDRARSRLYEQVRAEPREAPPGTRQVYSDLGFILLGALIESKTASRLDVAFQRLVFRPFGMVDTTCAPRSGDPGIAPTEDCPWRGRVLRGEVHDDNSFAAGGATGHAGVFSTALDLWRLAEAWRLADLGRPSALPVAVARRFWVTPAPPSTYALGWDTPTPGASSTGRWFSARSFGHLGFTGTSLWVDTNARWTVVLLTNRVHPRRDNNAIRAFRPRFHDAVSAWLTAHPEGGGDPVISSAAPGGTPPPGGRRVPRKDR